MADMDGDKAFEARLDRLFAESPVLGDSDLFALRVRDRLDRGWSVRAAAIGALGVAGGMVGVYQVAARGVFTRAELIIDRYGTILARALDHVLPWNLGLSGLPFAGEVVWMPAALGAVALGWAITRAIREI